MRATPILVVGLILVAGVATGVIRAHPGTAPAVIAIGLAGGIAALWLVGRSGVTLSRLQESPEIEDVDEARLRELIRGTSLHLREMRYRYSVRLPRVPVTEPDEQSFTAEVNQITLGFVPAVITDNRTDEEGLGYVAFVYDGRRWRGPGLPCPRDREAALAHAARCVAPLEPREGDEQ